MLWGQYIESAVFQSGTNSKVWRFIFLLLLLSLIAYERNAAKPQRPFAHVSHVFVVVVFNQSCSAFPD